MCFRTNNSGRQTYLLLVAGYCDKETSKVCQRAVINFDRVRGKDNKIFKALKKRFGTDADIKLKIENVIEEIKQCKSVRIEDLKPGSSGDGTSIENWDIKSVIWPIIHNADNSLNEEELDKLVSLMHPDEISPNIPKMFEYVKGKIKESKLKEKQKNGKAGKKN